VRRNAPFALLLEDSQAKEEPSQPASAMQMHHEVMSGSGAEGWAIGAPQAYAGPPAPTPALYVVYNETVRSRRYT
jgi:hypothetical protein